MVRLRWTLVLSLASACGNDKPAPPAPAAPVVVAAAPSPVPPPAATPAADRAAAFWTWFQGHAAALRADKDMRATMESISAELEKGYPGVFAEIGGDGADRTLVLSADGKRDLFPAVQEVYAARPKVPGWTIVAFRQRDAADAPFTIEMGSQKLSPDVVKFVAMPTGGKLDLRVFIPGYTTDDEMGKLAFIIMDHTVGEYDMETKVDGIEFASTATAPATARSLRELPALIDKLK